MLSTTAQQVVEQLLRGQFICRTTNEEGWRLLKSPAGREKVEDFLGQLNRTLAQVGTGNDGDVFFCGYRALNESERRVISQQFKDICHALTPLVEWLVLVQEATAQDAPLTEGAAVRLGELQTIVEDTPAFREKLAKISHFRFFNSTSTQVDGQIKQIFKRLVDEGYLIRPNPDKQIYIATGKLDYLYEVIRFIDETEGLNLEAQAETASQASLL